MTTGALIFAFDNEETDYIAMAEWSANNIRRHLNIPVAIVTDRPDHPRVKGFDSVIYSEAATGGTRWFEDYEKTVSWHNAGRTDAYKLTPWGQTLVLDADYIVASDQLKQVLESKSDFMCHRHAFDAANGNFFDELNVFGQHKMPMWWATVMMFRKSNTAAYIFDCMNMIRNNWQHYRDLYGIQRSTYRNDFALSIALGIVSGHTNIVDEIPWPLASITPSTRLEQTSPDSYKLTYQVENKSYKTFSITGLDLHAMGKRDLGAIVANS